MKLKSYLIEFRFQGRQNKEIKTLINKVNKKFNISPKNRPVPHITLVAPFRTRNQKRLVSDFKNICKGKKRIMFRMKGYGFFKAPRVTYINVEPSNEMQALRNSLLNRLKKYCYMCNTDIFSFLGFKFNKRYNPHITITLRTGEEKFKRILEYLKKDCKPPNKEYTLARTTLLNENRKIMYEYDFILGRMLNRRRAKSKRIYSKTIKRLIKKS